VEQSDRGGSHEQRSNQNSNQNWNRDRVNTEQRNSNWNRDRVNTEQRNSNWNRDQVNTEQRNSNWNRDRVNTEQRNANWNRDRVNTEQRNSNWSRDNANFNRGRIDSSFRNGGRVDSFRGRTPSYYNGRIDRFERWNGGFRVYLGGAPYPFFVPEAYFRSHGFRVGLSLRLGGFYNPLGYYDYYDPYTYGAAYGAYGPYYGSTVTSGDLRGVVESVDYRRGTLVLRDDISGNFVTTQMRGSDRMLDSLRPGDYVELQGDWVRGGIFEAYRADLLDNRDRGDNYR
jgi:hypothetical protein